MKQFTPTSLRHALERLIFIAALGAAVVTVSGYAGAQAPGVVVEDVEAAYREVDFERCAQLAREALGRGGQNPRQTARLQYLLGISSAALGQDAEATRAFVVLLAITPDVRLDVSLSPKLRAPYLEARGLWSSMSERLTLNAVLDGTRLHIQLSDPAHLIKKLRIARRGAGQASFRGLERDAQRSLWIELGALGPEVDVAVSALDESGNVLVEHGTSQKPLRLVTAASAALAPQQRSGPVRHNALLSGSLAALGVIATAGGVYFHVQRESRAAEWNGPGCERPGSTRGAACADVDQRRRQAEGMAIGLYSAGGALLVGSIVSYFVSAHSDDRRAGLKCAPGAIGPLTAECRLRF